MYGVYSMEGKLYHPHHQLPKDDQEVCVCLSEQHPPPPRDRPPLASSLWPAPREMASLGAGRFENLKVV